MLENCVDNSQELALRFANPYITQSSNFQNKYFAKNETKPKPAVTKKRTRISVNRILDPKIEFCCTTENCKKIFVSENGYGRHVSSEHGKNAEECPARILKVTKTEVIRDSAIQDSLNNTTENAGKAKIPFRITKPRSTRIFKPYQRPPSNKQITNNYHNNKLFLQTSETRSNIRARDGHNDSVEHEIFNSFANNRWRARSITKTEVKRNTAIRDSLNNTTENGEKVKIPFRITEPKPRSTFKPYRHPPSNQQITPSKIRTMDGHNELISKQKNIEIRNDLVQQEITNSCATVYEMVQLGCRDDFCVKMNKLLSKSRTTRYESITPNVFRQNIMSMSNDVESQLLRRVVKSRYYALQIAESVEVANFEILLVFVRYKFDSTIQESLLLSHHISPTIDGIGIFHIIDEYIIRNKLEWKNCAGINIACSPRRLQEIKNCIPKGIRFAYNFADRVAFLQNNISRSLREELEQIINIVNDNKMCALRWSHQAMKDNKFERIFIHTRYLWLGYTNTLSLVLEKPDKFGLQSSNQMYQLACLTDLFKFFNSAAKEIYIKKSESIFWTNDRINALIGTVKLYKRECDQLKFEVFPNVDYFAAKHDPDIDYDVLSRSLKYLANNLCKYQLLSDHEKTRYEWIRDPFHLTITELYPEDLSVSEKTILIKLATDSKMKNEYIFNTLEEFWIIASGAGYSVVAERALRFLLNFKNSYLLESCFAAFVDIRGDQLTDFKSENAYLRLKMSTIKPNLK